MDPLQKEVIDILLDQVEAVFRTHGLTDEESAKVWNGIEAWCLYQLLEKKGRFYVMAKKAERDALDLD